MVKSGEMEMRSLFDAGEEEREKGETAGEPGPSLNLSDLSWEELLERIQSCERCRLKESRSQVVPGEGSPEADLVFIGEAPGEVEDRLGRPFVGPAGQLLDKILESAGLAREEVYITNMVKCFISPRVMIYTAQGYKPIKDIRVGELVLTHRGRFRRVVYLRPRERLPKGSRVVRLTFQAPPKGGHQRPLHLTVTPEHPFLIDGEWKRAEEIKEGDRVRTLGDRCEVCGRIYFVRYDRYDHRPYHTCSYRCHNLRISHDERARKKISRALALKEQHAEGIRDPKIITRWAHERVRQLVAEGKAKIHHMTGEERYRGRVALGANVTTGAGRSTHRTGFGEPELEEILKQLKVEYIHHFAFPGSALIYDFCLPEEKILIEVRGPEFNNQAVQEKALFKDELARSFGFLLINLWWGQIIHQPGMVEGLLQRVLKNHSREYTFVDLVVTKVEHRPTEHTFLLYNIGVEEDESYIAAGIVSHNCRPPQNRTPQKDEVETCWPWLEAQLRRLRPRIIVALGNVPAQWFLKTRKGITALRGQFFPWEEGIEVFPMFHPSYLLRNPSKEKGSPKYLTWQDIQRVKGRLDELRG
ncbi:TPA: hypothetical protein EYP12_04250 [Candidatus Bipolaricaulota bacterium]|nr:hypothetical protein [Candidatus Bipolaricaulota bacterium]